MKRLLWLMIPVTLFGCDKFRAASTDPNPADSAAVLAPIAAATPDPAAVVDAGAAAVTAALTTPAPPPVVPVQVVAHTEPPDPIYEEESPIPSPDYVWVRGHWAWNGVDWGWNRGHWIAPMPDHVYIEPYYERVGGNVVFVSGYWGARNEPHYAYGGERILLNPPPRPPNYRRDEIVVIDHRVGPAPGARPAHVYQRAVGAARPVPTVTVPPHVVAVAPTPVPTQANVSANVNPMGTVNPNGNHAQPGIFPGTQPAGQPAAQPTTHATTQVAAAQPTAQPAATQGAPPGGHGGGQGGSHGATTSGGPPPGGQHGGPPPGGQTAPAGSHHHP